MIAGGMAKVAVGALEYGYDGKIDGWIRPGGELSFENTLRAGDCDKCTNTQLMRRNGGRGVE